MTLTTIECNLKGAKPAEGASPSASTKSGGAPHLTGSDEAWPKAAVSRGPVAMISEEMSRGWVLHAIGLLDAAIWQLSRKEDAAEDTILKAATLLRQQIDPQGAHMAAGEKGSLLAWQAHKVLHYIDAHLASWISVADLGKLIQWSEAHFSRSFRRTFGESPHAFVLRRRLELAIRLMLETPSPLSDIALRCGFTDQAHFCKKFREAIGQTPAAWRRVRTSYHGSMGSAPIQSCNSIRYRAGSRR
jgi:AraC family transcriptional regulator